MDIFLITITLYFCLLVPGFVTAVLISGFYRKNTDIVIEELREYRYFSLAENLESVVARHGKVPQRGFSRDGMQLVRIWRTFRRTDFPNEAIRLRKLRKIYATLHWITSISLIIFFSPVIAILAYIIIDHIFRS